MDYGNLLRHSYNAHVDRPEIWRSRRDEGPEIRERQRQRHKRPVEVPAVHLFGQR